MTRPPRLLDSSSNDALRSLLSSGLDDAPDARALPKVATALGLTAVTVTASGLVATSVGAQAKAAALASGASATAAGQAAATAGTAGFWAGSSALALGKTLLVSMVSAGALSVGVVAVHEYTNPSAANSARVEPATAVPLGSKQRAPHARTEQAPTAGMPASAPATAPAEPSPGVAQGSKLSMRPTPLAGPSPEPEAGAANVSQHTEAAPQRAGVLAREVRQIDSARQALESRDADAALAELDSYQRSRVVGVLDREALLLKIEALSQKQDLAQAKALARQYLQRFPSDAHAPRLRTLLGTAQGVDTTTSSVRAFPSE